jgi:hypothetical protein
LIKLRLATLVAGARALAKSSTSASTSKVAHWSSSCVVSRVYLVEELVSSFAEIRF